MNKANDDVKTAVLRYFRAGDAAALRRVIAFLKLLADKGSKGIRGLLGGSILSAAATTLEMHILPRVEEAERQGELPAR